MRVTTLGDLTHRFEERRGVCVLIAINERSRCKSRLAPALAPKSRLRLVSSMLSAVFAAAADARVVLQIIVVSPERGFVPADVLDAAALRALAARIGRPAKERTTLYGVAREVPARRPLAPAVVTSSPAIID
jgi:hypothetical protein